MLTVFDGIEALVTAREELLGLPVAEALGPGTGKGDSIVMDNILEDAAAARLAGPGRVLITEERGTCGDCDAPDWLFMDPLNMSERLKGLILAMLKEEAVRPGDSFRKAISYLKPERILFPSSSLTLVSGDEVMWNAFQDIAGGRVYAASPMGLVVFEYEVLRHISPERKPAGYIGTTIKPGTAYERNLSGRRSSFAHVEPGPHRVLYLTDEAGVQDIGAILSNGEKVTEWAGWLAWMKYGLSDVYAASRFDPGSREVYKGMAMYPERSAISGSGLDTRVLAETGSAHSYRDFLMISPR